MAKTPKHVLHWDELPTWMKVDPYIKRGYRKQMNSFSGCFWSLFYPHNEFVNIWSHLLPSLTLLGLLLGADSWVLYRGIEAPLMDNLVIQVYMMGTAGCLFFSVDTCLSSKYILRSVPCDLFWMRHMLRETQAFYHGINAHSQEVSIRFLKLDYLGIVISIVVSSISSTYFGLYSDRHLQTVYIPLSVCCAVGVFLDLLRPNADGQAAAIWR